jgi:hypothetical protein
MSRLSEDLKGQVQKGDTIAVFKHNIGDKHNTIPLKQFFTIFSTVMLSNVILKSAVPNPNPNLTLT